MTSGNHHSFAFATTATTDAPPIHRRYKGAITSKIKHATKLKTSPARLAQLLHNCCRAATVVQVLQDLFYVLLHALLLVIAP